MTIAIVNYGAGNLTSVKKTLSWMGQTSIITSDPDKVVSADKVIVPGVGHFAATQTLESRGLKQAIESTIAAGVPLLGICLGMQWMFATSSEAPNIRGLGVFAGECEHFPAEVKSPHVGWNQLELAESSRLLRGILNHSFVYFTHSYRVPEVQEATAICEYGGLFSAVVERDRVFGVQFHPEKSGPVGIKLLQNFCEMKC